MHSYEEKMRAVELYLKYDLSAASVINELGNVKFLSQIDS